MLSSEGRVRWGVDPAMKCVPCLRFLERVYFTF